MRTGAAGAVVPEEASSDVEIVLGKDGPPRRRRRHDTVGAAALSALAVELQDIAGNTKADRVLIRSTVSGCCVGASCFPSIIILSIERRSGNSRTPQAGKLRSCNLWP